MRVCRLPGLLLIVLLLARTAFAQSLPGAADRFFVTSDGVRLHYLEAGPAKAHTIIFIPGWTMPAWIWAEQIAAFSRAAARGPLTLPSPPLRGGEGIVGRRGGGGTHDMGDGAYHVIAFDPRGQGESAIAASGYEPVRRGQDIAELIAHVGGGPVVLVGWSLGVLDTLAYIHTHGDRAIAGLVLVDNSVGEEPAPRPVRPRRAGRPVPHPVFMENFVRTMFRTPQSAAWLDRLTEAALRTPDWAARELLEYPVPRTYWREAIYSTNKPVLYIVRPGLSGQAGNLERNRPDTESVVFTNAGHALFIDQAARFDALMGSFIRRRVWH